MPGNTLISSYLAGLHRHLPAGLADEVAGGLAEAYEYHLARGYGETAAARAAVSETGDLAHGLAGNAGLPSAPRGST